eukprot:scaffold2580_cov388-Prasinococcus_capsulatus_cf.AAC.17
MGTYASPPLLSNRMVTLEALARSPEMSGAPCRRFIRQSIDAIVRFTSRRGECSVNILRRSFPSRSTSAMRGSSPSVFWGMMYSANKAQRARPRPTQTWLIGLHGASNWIPILHVGESNSSSSEPATSLLI